MRRKLCFGLLLVCSIIVGSLLNASSDVNAVSRQLQSAWALQDQNSWAGASAGSFVSLSSGFVSTAIRYNNDNLYNLSSDRVVTFTGTFIALFDFYEGAINSPIMVTCPQFTNAEITSIDCDISSTTDVSAGQHFIVYNWTYTGLLTADWGQTTFRFSFYLRNNHNSAIRFYSSGLGFNVGESDETLTREAIQSFNRDVSSYIGSVVSSINANGNDLESAITSFNSDFNTYRTNTFNQLNSIDSNVSNIWQYLQDKQDQEEEDRDNIEEQSSDIDSDASDSASDAESQGTTLLGAFSAFVTALTSASPSNCVLDMDLGNLDLGNVDFCTLSPPQPIPTIASIFLILFCVPLSIATAKKVINLFRSFQ